MLDIPDDEADLAPWLERELVGLHLRDLVLELEALCADRNESIDLDSLLGDRTADVLEHGLGRLAPQTLRTLLQNPASLLQLQERVLVDGSDYWQNVERSAEHRQMADAGWERLAGELSETAPAVAAEPGRPHERPRTTLAWLTLAAAALLLVSVSLWRWPQPQGAGWGWQQPGALAVDVSAAEYLRHLAGLAEEWFNQRPVTPPELAQRILEFRAGCSKLILSEHEPLPPEDRAWLRERCRAWAKKLDAQVAALETGAEPELIRQKTDETIRKLIDALRKRADSLA